MSMYYVVEHQFTVALVYRIGGHGRDLANALSSTSCSTVGSSPSCLDIQCNPSETKKPMPVHDGSLRAAFHTSLSVGSFSWSARSCSDVISSSCRSGSSSGSSLPVSALAPLLSLLFSRLFLFPTTVHKQVEVGSWVLLSTVWLHLCSGTGQLLQCSHFIQQGS